jgi:uncharacterized protein YqkB
MHITFTPEAVEQIHTKLGIEASAAPYRIKLVYDSEGCGCAVDGVPQLWVVDQAEPGDSETEAFPIPVLYESRQAVFFEEEAMTVDYNATKRAFSLKSKQQIYNNLMRLIDKRIVE